MAAEDPSDFRELRLVEVTPANFGEVVALESGRPTEEFASAVWSLAQAGVYPHSWCRAIMADDSVVGLVLLEHFPERAEDIHLVQESFLCDSFFCDGHECEGKGPIMGPCYSSLRGYPECVDFCLCASCFCSGQYAARHGPFVHAAHLWRLMIDQRYQRLGLGRRALACVVDLVRSRGYGAIRLSYVQSDFGTNVLRPFYASAGFEVVNYVDADDPTEINYGEDEQPMILLLEGHACSSPTGPSDSSLHLWPIDMPTDSQCPHGLQLFLHVDAAACCAGCDFTAAVREFTTTCQVVFDCRGDIFPLHRDPVACHRAVWWACAACERATKQSMPDLCRHMIRRALQHLSEGVGEGACVTCGCSREYDAFGDRVCFCDLCSVTGCRPERVG